MTKLFATAMRVQEALFAAGRPFCFIGGIAVQRWGELRITKDADATVYTGFQGEEAVIQTLLQRFEGRQDDTAAFALRHRVLLLRETGSGVGIDISLGGLTFEQEAVERATEYRFTDVATLRTCSAEDLIVYKAFANREIDWHDVKGILIRQMGELNFELIERELEPLVELKEEPAILDKWQRLRKRYE